MEKAKLAVRAKKLKLPTKKQKENVANLTDNVRKNRRLKEFQKMRKEVQYCESEITRWVDHLENLDFNIPEQLKRLKKYRQLLINANFIGYARIQTI